MFPTADNADRVTMAVELNKLLEEHLNPTMRECVPQGNSWAVAAAWRARKHAGGLELSLYVSFEVNDEGGWMQSPFANVLLNQKMFEHLCRKLLPAKAKEQLAEKVAQMLARQAATS
jgi:hypothetical protein